MINYQLHGTHAIKTYLSASEGNDLWLDIPSLVYRILIPLVVVRAAVWARMYPPLQCPMYDEDLELEV